MNRAGWLALLVLVADLPTTLAAAQPRLAPAAWTRVEPGGATSCGLGTPYSFFHWGGADPERLVIYFQGGGACWNWVSCSGMFDTRVDADELSEYKGIFDRSNPENPFKDFSVIVVPYCTGDVHIGDASRRYGDDPSSRPVAHRGYRNVEAVLDWLAKQKRTIRNVVVTGTSAGSYGALFHTPAIANLFPSAKIVMLGDSGVPLLSDNREVLRQWGADDVLARLWNQRATADPLDAPLRQAHLVASQVGARLAQITTDRDSVQSAFYIVSGSPRWRNDTYALLEQARRLVPGFRSFVVEGADHGLLPTDAFYRYQADGVYLKHWVRRLIHGEAVEDVRCGVCRLK